MIIPAQSSSSAVRSVKVGSRRTRGSSQREWGAIVSADNLTLPCSIRRKSSDARNVRFFQFAITQKWSVFSVTKYLLEKHVNFKCPPSFNFHLTEPTYFMEGWRFDPIRPSLLIEGKPYFKKCFHCFFSKCSL